MSDTLKDQVLKDLVWSEWFSPRNEAVFDINKAELAACLARDSYFEDERHHNTLDNLEFKETQLFTDDHLQATVGCRDIQTPQGNYTLFAVVFRGSDETEDWLHNLDFRLSQYLPRSFPIHNVHRFKVHRGFLKMEKDFERSLSKISFSHGMIKGTLKEILADPATRAQSLFWVNGHSLGGAIATLFSVRLRDYFQVPNQHIQAYTFGAPPVGNRHIASYNMGFMQDPEALNHDVAADPLHLFRIINTEDPVAGPVFSHPRQAQQEGGRLPLPPYKWLGLEHFGREVRFAPRSNPEFYELFYKLAGTTYSNANFFDVHFMPAYLAGIDLLRKLFAETDEAPALKNKG